MNNVSTLLHFVLFGFWAACGGSGVPGASAKVPESAVSAIAAGMMRYSPFLQSKQAASPCTWDKKRALAGEKTGTAHGEKMAGSRAAAK